MRLTATLQTPAARIAVIALWGALLLLPFRGWEHALMLAGALGIALTAGLLVRRLNIPLPAFSLERVDSIKRYRMHIGLALLLFASSFPFILNNYYIDILIIAAMYAILAMGLNIIVGQAGLLNIGFAAFYAVGAYAYALLSIHAGLGFWLCVPIATIFSSLVGLVLAIPALRLKGDYLAIVTLGFGEITHLILTNWDSVTGGPNGLSGIAAVSLPGLSLPTNVITYYVVFASMLLSLFVIRRVETSRIGRAWRAIRENEIAASAVGINTTRYKLLACAFGAFFGGLAGALFAAKMQFISPESFTFMESVMVLGMVILGGLGNTFGAVLGAFILIFLPEALREVHLYRMLLLGAGLVLLMRYRPQGLLGGR
jgi:branched-chain amino acid transport system permease protein